MKGKSYCCQDMTAQINWCCQQHSDLFECPDVLVVRWEKFDEFGIPIRDGGRSISTINYCPWCGQKLPESKRDRWFEELEALGYDNPSEQDIPEAYRTSAWYRNNIN